MYMYDIISWKCQYLYYSTYLRIHKNGWRYQMLDNQDLHTRDPPDTHYLCNTHKNLHNIYIANIDYYNNTDELVLNYRIIRVP